mmetsp:Transcript_11678/g.21207  ORF Transcript_11678/g.21207 Transcript_11678/m.21207 type:complete len:87 (+) Transcript_11678:3783-4043(+)
MCRKLCNREATLGRGEFARGCWYGCRTLAWSLRSTPTTTTTTTASLSTNIPVEHEPFTKPDYLQQRLQYKNSALLLDKDDDAVMMS